MWHKGQQNRILNIYQVIIFKVVKYEGIIS